MPRRSLASLASVSVEIKRRGVFRASRQLYQVEQWCMRAVEREQWVFGRRCGGKAEARRGRPRRGHIYRCFAATLYVVFTQIVS